MVDGAVLFAEVFHAVQMDFGPRGDFGIGVAVFFRIEIQVLAVEYFDGALVAAKLLAIAIVHVTEVAAVVDVEAVRIFVDGAQAIGHVAIIGFVGPAIDAAGCHAGERHGLAQDEVYDVGLVDQQVGRDATGVIPIKPPLEIALGVPGALGRRPQKFRAVGILRVGFGRDRIAPGWIIGRRIAIPERAHVMDVPNLPLFYHLLGFLVQRGAAVLRAHLYDFAGFLPLVDDVEALFDGVSQRFFNVHVLAGTQGGDGHVMMQMLGRHDEDGIDGLVGQQFAVVIVGLGRDAVDGLDAI